MPAPLDGKFYGIIHRHKDNAIEPPDSWMVFVARDNALLPTLEFYRKECQLAGAATAQLLAVDELIERVRRWRLAHPEQCKVPDVADGELSLELAMPVICDGCNVREPFEHRCHGEQSVVMGEQTGKPCECQPCRELEALTPEQIRESLFRFPTEIG